MANLSKAEAIQLIKTPKNQREIIKAKAKKVRHALHTETETDTDQYQFLPGHAKFLSWIASILDSEENFARFKSLYRPPLVTNEFTESIYSQFQKVFEAENAFQKFNFTDPDLDYDFSEYRKKLGDYNFWQTQGFETFKTSIDNIVVIDLPSLQKDEAGNYVISSELPEPYYYILDINHLIDVDNKKVKSSDGKGGFFYYFKTEYLIFWDKEGEVCVFDDTFYRRFKYDIGGEPVQVGEEPHNLGYCPARSFWSTPMNSKTNIMKLSPITNSLSELDWYLAYSVFGMYLKMYAPFPIYAVYKSPCNWKDQSRQMQCRDSFLVPFNADKNFVGSEQCPRCKNKMRVGPGNILTFKAPQDKDQPDLLQDPVKVYPAEEVSVNVVNTELKNKKESIFNACVGIGGDTENKQAKNEMQIEAGFESKTNVLLGIKRNFETIHSFVLETVARLRYNDQFVSLSINYGDKFFVTDESAELEDYKTAKEQGLPSYDLAMRRAKINGTRYRNQPDQMERYVMLMNLDPFPDMEVSDVVTLKKDAPDIVDPLEFILKVNFNRFISRFERDQASLLNFGKQLDFDKRINAIYQILLGYAKENQAAIQASSSAPAATPAVV